jgi:hypothetical protein
MGIRRRRQLNDRDRENIRWHLAACWNTESHQWLHIRDGKPYTRAHYEYHNKWFSESGTLTAKNTVDFNNAVIRVLQKLGPKEAILALRDLYSELWRIATQNEQTVDPETLAFLSERQSSLSTQMLSSSRIKTRKAKK